MLKNEKILITGPTSQVGFPVARELARDNEVYGLARFSAAADRARIEALGVKCLTADLAAGSLDAVPDDFTYVLHFAVTKSGEDRFDYDLAANAEGTGRLMSHCRQVKAWLQCSSAGVYQPAGHKLLKETDPLGDNHRNLLPTYSICKIATEVVARFACREWKIPTIIARLSVPYGDNGGWPAMHFDCMRTNNPVPVHTDRPSLYNPIHEDDYIDQIPKLLAAATVPATTVNWGGEPVSIEEWCEYMAEISGLKAEFFPTDRTLPSIAVDVTRLREIVGPEKVPWRDGMRRMIRARHPELKLRG